MPVLVVKEGVNKGKQLPLNLERGQLYCGSGSKVTFKLDDEKVAEKHFRLVKDGDKLTIYHLEPGKDIFVNGEAIEGEAALAIGDTIELGDSVLEIAPPKGKSGATTAKEKTSNASGKKSVEPGFEIAGCVLEELLGESSSSLVYSATQKSMDRVVAVKILKPDIAENEIASEDFLSKARGTAKLNHDKLVQVMDVGCESGVYYVIAEYMPGGNLSDMLSNRDNISWSDAEDLLNQLAEAVDFLHSKGTCHGAIRPENILLDNDGGLKLSDTGIAGYAADPGSDMSRAHYIAPEVSLDKKGGSVSADLYAIGVVFYELLSGKLPFSGDNVRDLRDNQAGGDYEPVSDTCKLPDKAAECIGKLLDPDSSKRFASIEELVKELSSEPASGLPKSKSRQKSRGKGGGARIKSRSPSVSAAEIIKTKKMKAKEQRTIKPVHIVLGIIVLVLVGAGIYIKQMPDPVYESLVKIQDLMDKGKLDEAKKIVDATNKNWPSKYLPTFEAEEKKLALLIAGKSDFDRLNNEWNEYIVYKRENGHDVSGRKQKCLSLLAQAKKNAYAKDRGLVAVISKELRRIKNEE